MQLLRSTTICTKGGSICGSVVRTSPATVLLVTGNAMQAHARTSPRALFPAAAGQGCQNEFAVQALK